MIGTTEYLIGDVLAKLADVPEKSVQCVVTSPPYWSLRDYGTAAWEGGDEGCDHRKPAKNIDALVRNSTLSTKSPDNHEYHRAAYRDTCHKCGATRIDQQLGLEATPEEFVAKMVEVFGEVRRVMRDDATCWINLGDSYEDKQLQGMPWRVALALQADGYWLRDAIIWAKPSPMPGSQRDRCTSSYEFIFQLVKGQHRTRTVAFADLAPEYVHYGKSLGCERSDSWSRDLCERIATAIFEAAQLNEDFSLPPFYSEKWQQLLSGDGSNSIGNLPSVHRVTAHAARFLNAAISTKEFLCKLDRVWTDLRNSEPFMVAGRLCPSFEARGIFANSDGTITIHHAGQVSKVDILHCHIVVTVPSTCKYFFDMEAVKEKAEYGYSETVGNHAGSIGGTHEPRTVTPGNGGTRIPRNVWRIASEGFSDAHFATFPLELALRCIRAGTSEKGCCPECGAAWERLVEKAKRPSVDPSEIDRYGTGKHGVHRKVGGQYQKWLDAHPDRTIGWQPGCGCHGSICNGKWRWMVGLDHDPIPCTVLDPFAGAGTTNLAANLIGRDSIYIDLNPDYADMARKRIAKGLKPGTYRDMNKAVDAPLFEDIDQTRL